MSINDKVVVNLGERSYPIYIGRDNIYQVGELMKMQGFQGKAVCVTNPTVGGLYADRLVSSITDAGFNISRIDIPDGEEYKTLEQVSHIYDKLIEYRIERQNPLVALGGGVIGDIAGFAAATYLRGIPYIQIPTTLLAQVDSSVGGKTAVNHQKGKNLIGSFYQPKMVVIDINLLKTLGQRDLRAGLVEVIKYGIIRDNTFFAFLEDKYEDILSLGDSLLHAIKVSCQIKAKVVEEDERERNIRAILNFGHTFGHAIEAMTDYKEVRHGEAVAIGMVAAARLSLGFGICSRDVYERIERLLSKVGLPVRISDIAAVKPSGVSLDKLANALEIDKKVAGGRIKFVLVEDIGKVMLRQVGSEDFPLDLSKILN